MHCGDYTDWKAGGNLSPLGKEEEEEEEKGSGNKAYSNIHCNVLNN